MRLTRKRLILGGASAAAFVLASSAAFACLTPKGQITLQATSANGDTVKATATPTHGTFCVNPINAAEASTGTGRVTVTVAPSSCLGSATSQLAAGTATVVLQYDNTKPGWSRSPVPGSPWTWVADNGCFGPNRPASYTLGSMSISSGSGSAGFNIPSTLNMKADANEAGHICVKASVTSEGAFAPFRIV